MRKRIITVVVIILVGAGLLVVDLGLRAAISAAHREIGTPPDDLDIKTVTFRDQQNREVSGWAIDGKPGHGVILLLHGIRSDRRSMLSRARFLSGSGYSILMIDLAAHGESEGDNESEREIPV